MRAGLAITASDSRILLDELATNFERIINEKKGP